MVTLISQLAAALGLVLVCSLLDLWWAGAGPPALELWLTWLPGQAVRAVLPSAANGMALVVVVLALQHWLLVRLLVLARNALRPRALPQSSALASSSGNSTSVKPNWLKSRTRIG